MDKKDSNSILDVSLFKRLLSFAKPYRITFILVLVSAVLLSGFSTLSPYLLKITIDDYITLKDYDGMLLLIALMVLTLVLEVVFQFVFIYYANWLGQHVIYDLRNTLYRHMIQFKMAYYDKSAVGRLVTRVVSDIETISGIFSQGLFMIIADLLKMVVVIVVMWTVSWKLSIIVFSVLPIILFATRQFQKAMKSAFDEVRTQVANLNSFVQERISGMSIVQLFGRESLESAAFKDINNKHRKAWLKTVWYNSIFFPIAELSTSITIGLLVWFGGLNVIAGSKGITLGIIFLFIQLSQMLFRPLRQIADKFNTLQMGMVAVRRVMAVLDTHESISNNGSIPKNEISGNVSFEDVTFSYKEDETVLHGISFNMAPGETVAVVGATGAGKSTLINILSRFYEIDGGKVTLDGVNIEDYDRSWLRKQIGVVLQDVFLFADTIYNNITLWDTSISEDDVIAAAKKIGVHSFISSLPEGYHFNVKERGGMLSTGQRQLIAFLRAYVIQPKILVLDEATSSIDTHAEKLIQKATKEITKGKTSLVIAHRLATIQRADSIIVLDKGRIVESGTHSELLKIAGGHYKNLYEVQFVNAEPIV